MKKACLNFIDLRGKIFNLPKGIFKEKDLIGPVYTNTHKKAMKSGSSIFITNI